MEHLTAEQVSSYFYEQLARDEEASVEEHLESCAACRSSFETFAVNWLTFPMEEWAKRKSTVLDRVTRALPLTVSGPEQPVHDLRASWASRFWDVLRTVKFELAPLSDLFEGIPGLPAHSPLGAASADGREQVVEGTTQDGLVSYCLWCEDGGIQVRLSSRCRELAGTLIQVSVGTVAITGTQDLPHLKLEPDGAEVSARATIKRRHFAAKAALLGAVEDWAMRLEEV